MDDLKVALEELREESDSGTLEPVAALRPKRRWAWAVVAPVALALLGAGAWYFLRSKPAAPQRAALTRLTSDSGLTTAPVLSADGTRVAYASDREGEGGLDIWIQQVATGDRLRLTQNDADESEPAFSPDGKLIAYWAGGWGQQGRVQGSLFVIPSEGGQPRQIRSDFKRAAFPQWLPDGRHMLFYADQGGATADVDAWVTSLDEDGTPAVRTGLAETMRKQKLPNWGWSWQWIAHGAGGGYLLLSARSGDAVNIWGVPLSPRTFQVSGPAEQLTFGAATQILAHAVPVAGNNLRMVFAGTRPNSDIWALPLDADRALARKFHTPCGKKPLLLA